MVGVPSLTRYGLLIDSGTTGIIGISLGLLE